MQVEAEAAREAEARRAQLAADKEAAEAEVARLRCARDAHAGPLRTPPVPSLVVGISLSALSVLALAWHVTHLQRHELNAIWCAPC